MIGGRFVVADRRLRTAPADEIIDEAQAAANRIWDAAGLPPFPASLSPTWPLPGRAGRAGRTWSTECLTSRTRKSR